MSAVLEVSNLRKSFGGITAVDGVSFEVREGEILGIIGPNGSGKSTLFNCILGQLQPTEGEVRVDGKMTTGMRPCDLNRLGVSRTFQLLQVFPQLTVRENLILAGQEHKARCSRACSGARRRARRRRRPDDRFFRLSIWRPKRRACSATASRSCSMPRWRSWPGRAWCCSTSRPAAST